jgi:N-acetylmuramoyl-L-alanine amidase
MYLNRKTFFLSQAFLLLSGFFSRSFAKSTRSKSISLAQIARLYSMQTTQAGRQIMMKNKWNSINVRTNGRTVGINGVNIWLHYPCFRTNSGWSIRMDDFQKTIDPILRSYKYLPAQIPKVIVLDPGHGGKDSGAIGKRKVYEKLAVLSIALRVRKKLQAKNIKVYMTRSTDRFLTLEQRSAYAKKVGADLFISIHADAAGAASANGIETFVMTASGYDSTNSFGRGEKGPTGTGNKRDAANAILGFSIQSNLLKQAKRTDRGLRRARFAVLRNAPCPAVLVECGFLSNPTEEKLMLDKRYRDKLAQGITNGILGYLILVKRVHK